MFVLPFDFVKYITKCIESIKKTNDIWNKPIKKGLALKVKIQNKIGILSQVTYLSLPTYLFKSNNLTN